MAEDWNSVAAEVDVAIRSVGDVSHPDGFPATLRHPIPSSDDPDRPWSGGSEYSYVTVRVIIADKEIRDQSGTLIGQTRRTATFSGSSGVVPEKGDSIAMGITSDQHDENTPWLEIIEVRPLAPGGIAVLYEVDLGS